MWLDNLIIFICFVAGTACMISQQFQEGLSCFILAELKMTQIMIEKKNEPKNQ